ncbi:acetyl-CoA acetyltransferase [Burkholderia paludis]|uniref:Acetyl-CoA acetyltransferase n=1 Tax=Burkholderia paludis TaxID=1506587 RepID=A0A6J5DER7_9BURK|nr:hypothetical protein LMG30113_01563 [Burkholderia paludis]VWB51108.1 acetyl-CoA acetyltransferase [Burkholderia paludis]
MPSERPQSRERFPDGALAARQCTLSRLLPWPGLERREFPDMVLAVLPDERLQPRDIGNLPGIEVFVPAVRDVIERVRRKFEGVLHDETPRPDTSLAKMAKLEPLMRGGSLTAAVASQTGDAAAALHHVFEPR